jgi:hypothetical protein
MRARLAESGHLLFRCPGCDMLHAPTVAGVHPQVWSWNGSLERPTLQPSVLVRWQHGEQREERRCHSFVADGRIQFLSDCTHALAGQTVDLPDVDA